MSFDQEAAIRELAAAIAGQAEAIAAGTLKGPRYAAILRIQGNLDTLAAYVGDDRVTCSACFRSGQPFTYESNVCDDCVKGMTL